MEAYVYGLYIRFMYIIFLIFYISRGNPRSRFWHVLWPFWGRLFKLKSQVTGRIQMEFPPNGLSEAMKFLEFLKDDEYQPDSYTCSN